VEVICETLANASMARANDAQAYAKGAGEWKRVRSDGRALDALGRENDGVTLAIASMTPANDAKKSATELSQPAGPSGYGADARQSSHVDMGTFGARKKPPRGDLNFKLTLYFQNTKPRV
jgi:hypothetical protein